MMPILLMALTVLPLSLAIGDDADSTAIQYYLDRARNTFESSYIFNLKRDFEFRADAIATLTNYRGTLDRADTSAYDIKYSAGGVSNIVIVDSSVVSYNVVPDMTVPDMPWKLDDRFYFFPNDTGGNGISIGFEPRDATIPGATSGYIVIDRYNFTVKSVTIYVTDHPFSDRYSRVYNFEYRDLMTYPVKLERHWRGGGFWGRQYYYQKITFGDYKSGE